MSGSAHPAPFPPPRVTGRSRPAFLELVRCRVLEFCREPEALFWVYCFPLFMIVSLGIAFRQKPLAVPRVDVVANESAAEDAAVIGADRGPEAHVFERAPALERLRTGRCDLVVERASDGRLAFHFDPTRPESVLARDRARDALERGAGRRDLILSTDVACDAPGGRYIDFVVPGLMALSLLGGGLWGVGFAVVEMRIRKLLKRFFASPLRRWQFLGGVMVSRMVFVIPEMLLLVAFSRWLFGVRVFGSPWAVAALLALGSVAFSGIGLLVAARAKTLESVSGGLNLIMLPMWLSSGVFFARDRYPDWLQPWLFCLPLTPLVDALRGVMLEGRCLFECGAEIVALAAWAVVSFVVALRIFRWQ